MAQQLPRQQRLPTRQAASLTWLNKMSYARTFVSRVFIPSNGHILARILSLQLTALVVLPTNFRIFIIFQLIVAQ